MSFMELANNRQSDRTFSTQEVNRKDLLKCVQAAQLAPSACNSQPWKFIIIDNQTLLQQAAAVIEDNPMKINKFAAGAPVLVAVVEEPALLMNNTVSNRWAQFDLGSATEHFCLQAAELGLGTCIMGAFNEEKMKELLHVPQNSNIFVMLAVGYPASNVIRTKSYALSNCFMQTHRIILQ